MKKSKVLLFTSILIVLALIFSIVFETFFLPDQLQKKMNGNNIGTLQVHCGEVQTNFWARQLIIRNFELHDSSTLTQISVPYLKLEGISLMTLLFKRQIKADHIFIRQPHFRLVQNNNSLKTSFAKQNGATSISVHTDRLNIDGASICMTRSDLLGDTILSGNFNLNLWNFATKSSENHFLYQNNSFDRIRIHLEQGSYLFASKLYSFACNHVDFDSEEGILMMEQAKIVSTDSKYEIGKKRGVETDWLDFQFEGFSLHDIQLNDLLNDTVLIISNANLQKITASAFKDKRLPFPNKSDTQLPMDMLDDLPLLIHCDSFLIHDGTIKYEERVVNSSQAGFVNFSNLNAKISQLSTIDSLIKHPTSVSLSANVMDQAILSVDFIFPNKKFPKTYRASGKLGEMPIASFNPILTQNVKIKVISGNVKELTFNFNYNNNFSNGDLLFEYENLKVNLLDHNDYSNKNVKSFLVNSFVLHKDNSRLKRNYREGKISFNRDKKKSIFNYWWKSVLSGLKSIAIL